MKSKSLPAPSDSVRPLMEMRHGYLYWSEHPDNKGRNFRHKAIGNQKKPGSYCNIKLDGIDYSLHRVVYWYATGEWPHIVVHKDGNTLNNHIDNLEAGEKRKGREKASKDVISVWSIQERKRKDGSPRFDVYGYFERKKRYVASFDDRATALFAASKMKEILGIE